MLSALLLSRNSVSSGKIRSVETFGEDFQVYKVTVNTNMKAINTITNIMNGNNLFMPLTPPGFFSLVGFAIN